MSLQGIYFASTRVCSRSPDDSRIRFDIWEARSARMGRADSTGHTRRTPADLALHISGLSRSEVTAPLHRPCNLTHQIDDGFIPVSRPNPFAQAEQVRGQVTHSEGNKVEPVFFAEKYLSSRAGSEEGTFWRISCDLDSAAEES